MQSTVRRRVILSAAFAALLVAVLSAMSPARAEVTGNAQESIEPLVFDVVQMSGFLDGIVADYLERSIERAENSGSGGVILQVNSTRAVIDDERLTELAEQIANADIPVYAWVGPSGA